MKKLILTSASMALLLFSSCSDTTLSQKSYNQGINIIPAPLSLVQNEGNFKLTENCVINASTPEAKTIADFFAARMNLSTGFTITTIESESTKDISLIIDKSLKLNDEGYTLNVTSQNVTVKAKSPQGIFYGMQSFLQLLPAEIENGSKIKNAEWTAPCVAIKDEPRFKYRGTMLDPCRHFMPVEYIKKQIDVLSMFKINRVHIHLTEDQAWRIEIKKYPKLTEIGSKRIEGEGSEHKGFYTQEEIKDIVKYAADRFVTIIPEIELPGHEMAAIASYPELSCKGEQLPPRNIWGVENVVMCAGKESTFNFLENVFKEIIPLFPSEYYHIGGDECPKTSWKNCPLCQARIKKEHLQGDDKHTAEEKLQSYFVQRMEKFLAKHGKKIIGWDEILEGGLAPTATVMSWRGEAGGIAAALMNHNVIMTPGANGMYLDHYQGDYKIEPVAIGGYSLLSKTYSYNPVPDTLTKMGKDNLVLGVQCNCWSEYMYSEAIREYRTYPRSLAVAEIGWTSLNRKDYSDFERRINNALVRLDGHDINYHIPLPEQPNGSCNFVAFTDKATLEFKTTRPIKMVYTLDGSEPTSESTAYTGPIEITDSKILKIRSVLPSGKMSTIREIKVEKQALAPAKTVEKTTPGLEMKVAKGKFLNTDDIKNVKDWEISEIKEFKEMLSCKVNSEDNLYAAIATGYVNIPEDGVYYFSTDQEEVWIDGKLLISNKNEVKRFSRHDSSVALGKGLHEIKVVFLSHIMGGWPSSWNSGNVRIRKSTEESFKHIKGNMLVH